MATLNMMRALLVGGAALAAAIAAFFQLWAVVAILFAGIVAHGVLWLHLHRLREAPPAAGPGPGSAPPPGAAPAGPSAPSAPGTP